MESETIENVLARIADRPADAELFQRLGQAYLKTGRLDEARLAYERSLELEPGDPFTHLYLGNWFYGRRMYPEALARFQHAATLMPHEAVVFWCQGDAYRDQGRFDLAQVAYDAAVRADPDDLQAQQKLAQWHQYRKGTGDQTPAMIDAAYRNDHAATTVLLAERWLRDHPDDLWIIHKYAAMLYQMTRYDEAIQVCVDAIARFPDSRWGLYNQVGHLHRYRGNFADAELWYQKAKDEDPEEAASYIFLGAVQARQGKLKEAEATHRAATRCADGCIDEAHHNLGLVLRGQGRLAESVGCFRKAIELCPTYADAIEALADVESALALSRGDGA